MVARSIVALFGLVASSTFAAASSYSCDAQPGSSKCKAPRASESSLLQAQFTARSVETSGYDEEENETSASSLLQQSKTTKFSQMESTFEDIRDVEFPVEYEGTKSWLKFQKADILYPTNIEVPEDGWPSMILLHGLGGDKSALRGLAKRFMNYGNELGKGRLTMCPNYRFGDRRHPEAKAAIKFLDVGDGKTTYNTNPTKISLYGYSWGGTIAADLLMTDEYTQQTVLSGIVVSGTSGIHKRSASLQVPPLLLVHCDNDKTMSINPTNDLFKALQKVKHPAVKLDICKSGHMPMKDKEYFVPLVANFMNQYDPEPEPAGKCKKRCKKNSAAWSVKLTWPDCSACEVPTSEPTPEPTPEATPESAGKCKKKYCKKNTEAWSVKLTWPDCSGCEP